MSRHPIGYFVLFILIVLSFIHMAAYYPILPARVASHFNSQGHVDGWMGKEAFVATYAGTVWGIAIVFSAIGLGLSRLPQSMISLPNKDYWLAPQRRKATFGFFSAAFVWFTNATVLFLMVWFHASFAASLGRNPAPWLFPSALTLYVAFTLVWLLCLLRRFRRPKET